MEEEYIQGIDIDLSEEPSEDIPEDNDVIEDDEVIDESIDDSAAGHESDQLQNESIDEKSEDEKIEDALKKILVEYSEKEEKDSEEDFEGTEEVSEENSEELIEKDSDSAEVETLPAVDYQPYLTDILNEIKDIDSSKEITQMYQAMTTDSDNNLLSSTLNNQSATNVILMAIFTVLLVDTAIQFIRGIL